MRYDLRALVLQRSRRRGEAAAPSLPVPLAPELSYLAQLRRLERELARLFREVIAPVYRQRLLTMDADQSTMDQVRLVMNSMVRMVSEQVQSILGLEGRRHTKQWMREAQRTFSVNLEAVVREEDLEALLEAAALRNSALIRGLSDEMVKRVATDTTSALLNGDSAAKLQERVKRTLGVMDSRARLIARDQVGKLTSDLNRFRHQQAGVNDYIWRTSQDERVRPLHSKLEGRRYAYGEPTGAEEGLPPGQPIQCRCIAEGIVRFD